MAGIALRRHRLKLAGRQALVAGIAVNGSVGPGQWEPVVMLLDLLDRHRPTSDRVALLAIRSQLPLVNIRMAVLASLPNVGEYRLDVALDAGDRLVHAAQRVARLIMIKLRNRPDGFPSGRRMAVLTRKVQIPVWTMRTSGCLRLRTSRESGKRH